MNDEQKQKIEELQRTINDAQEQCKRIQEELNKPDKKWGFKVEEGFYVYGSGGHSEFIYANANYSDMGMLFKTEEQAEEFVSTRKKVINIKHRIAELNEGWKPDWTNNQFDKHCFYKNGVNGRVNITENSYSRGCPVSLYMKSGATANQIQEEFGDDLNALFEDY